MRSYNSPRVALLHIEVWGVQLAEPRESGVPALARAHHAVGQDEAPAFGGVAVHVLNPSEPNGHLAMGQNPVHPNPH